MGCLPLAVGAAIGAVVMPVLVYVIVDLLLDLFDTCNVSGEAVRSVGLSDLCHVAHEVA